MGIKANIYRSPKQVKVVSVPKLTYVGCGECGKTSKVAVHRLVFGYPFSSTFSLVRGVEQYLCEDCACKLLGKLVEIDLATGERWYGD